jgi:2,5-diketo-D-gluconate reductase A
MSMTDHPTVAMNDGRRIPQLGFGTWQISRDQAPAAVAGALEAGYRLIDTAAVYHNEDGVGEGIASAPVPRDELFITTKVWNDRHGLRETPEAFHESLARLGLGYVDLYLIHWPAPRRNAYVDTWKALIRLREEGLALSIGVSNFDQSHLERIIEETGVVPAVNQVELHPWFQQRDLRSFHAGHRIVTQSWSPLAKGELLADATVVDLARKHRRTPAQVILRWHLDSGLVTIPKSVTPSRIRENIAIFDFSLDADDLTRIEQLDDPRGRIGAEPDQMK